MFAVFFSLQLDIKMAYVCRCAVCPPYVSYNILFADVTRVTTNLMTIDSYKINVKRILAEKQFLGNYDDWVP